MSYLVAVLVSLVVMIVSFVGLNQEVASRFRIVAVAADCEETYPSKKLPPAAIIVIVLILGVVAFFSTIKVMTKVSNPIGNIKMLLALVCMIGAACFDFREHRIPNIFPLIMAVGAAILLFLGVVLNQAGSVDLITTSIVASVGCAVVLVVASILSKQGIGAGDIKLISALALLTGVYSVMGTIFFGILTCSFYAILILIIKRKNASKSVPFGPFLLFGYISMVFMINF